MLLLHQALQDVLGRLDQRQQIQFAMRIAQRHLPTLHYLHALDPLAEVPALGEIEQVCRVLFDDPEVITDEEMNWVSYVTDLGPDLNEPKEAPEWAMLFLVTLAVISDTFKVLHPPTHSVGIKYLPRSVSEAIATFLAGPWGMDPDVKPEHPLFVREQQWVMAAADLICHGQEIPSHLDNLNGCLIPVTFDWKELEKAGAPDTETSDH